MEVKRSKAEQRAHTRQQLLAVARALFAERGYAATATEDVVERAGVTRGALYYHFKDKRDLFRAVLEDIQMEMARTPPSIPAAPRDPWAMMRAGVHGYLDACLDPRVQRIVLQDGPAVLGWAEWRALDQRYNIATVTAALARLMDAGIVARLPVEPLAQILLAALAEAGLLIANAADVQGARVEVGQTVDRLLDGLRATPLSP
jgi:AcrR family transcriptional regulator